MREVDLGMGHMVVGFDSMEEMQEYMEKQEREANERTLDPQWEIDWGSYVIRIMKDLVIWGHIFGTEEFLKLERDTEGGRTPEAEAEIQAELASLIDDFERGYRYGVWYSVVEPDGEYGSTHVSTLWEISEADFRIGIENDWVLPPELAEKIRREILAALPEKEKNDE